MLKLTTDKHEASRGLSATAELLVLVGHNLHGEYLQNGSGHFPLPDNSPSFLHGVGHSPLSPPPPANLQYKAICRLVSVRSTG